MLKYENTAEIGNRIKAFDFQPCPGRDDRFFTGIVREKGWDPNRHFRSYKVEVDGTSHGQYDYGEIVYVPMQMSMTEYDGRVIRL